MRGFGRRARFASRRKFSSVGIQKSRIRLCFGVFYTVALSLYIIVGLQPITADATADNRLFIPSIGLSSPVKNLARGKSQKDFEVPETVVGAYNEQHYKTLLVGHSTTVFQNLSQLSPNEVFIFDGKRYVVESSITVSKDNVDMNEILAATERPTVIIMTCAGEPLGLNDYAERLILTAVQQDTVSGK